MLEDEDENPLRKLVGEEELDRELLLRILDPYLRFDEDGNIIYRSGFDQLASKEKILLFLLAQKAISDLGLSMQESTTPNQIAEEISVNYNTVRSSLSRLKNRGLVKSGRSSAGVTTSSSGSHYQVPNSVVEEVDELIND